MIAISGTSRCSSTCPTDCMGTGRYHTEGSEAEIAGALRALEAPPPIERKGKARTGRCAPMGRSVPPARAAARAKGWSVKLEERVKWA